MPPIDVDALREREFPHVGESIYLNAASVGPLPRRSVDAVQRFNAVRERIHEFGEEHFSEPLVRSRNAAAALIGADPEEIALGWNTSYGINLVALGLEVESGRSIVVSDREFPANIYPWMGVADARLDIVPTDQQGRPDEPRLFERLDRGDVAVFALSSVQFTSGYLADVERFGRFCRERDILFVVDAIQSLGQVPIDVRAANVDVLACGGHKWLLAPFGTGFAYIRREIQPRLQPRVVGWTGMAAAADLNALLDYQWGWHDDARKYEVATLPMQDFAGFAASLELLNEVGVPAIREHQREILQPLVDWLTATSEVEAVTDLAEERRSGIIAFRPSDPQQVFESLTQAGVGCVLREGAVRLSAHLYNTREEIEKVVAILDANGGR